MDFKTGLPKDEHREQLETYAVLLWRRIGRMPRRGIVRCTRVSWRMDVFGGRIEKRERAVAAAIDGADAYNLVRARPGQANGRLPRLPSPRQVRRGLGSHCAESAPAVASAGSCDIEVTVASPPVATGYSATLRNGRELAVVFEAAIGATLPAVSTGARLRLLDALRRDSASIEIKPWTEVYVVSP